MDTDSSELSHDPTPPTRGTNPSSRPAVSPENVLPEHSSASMKVSETFVSRQGEGKLTGVDSFFVRMSGCNLRCHFCDTPYASWNPTGRLQSISSLLDEVKLSGLDHVVLTGGEPLLPPSIETLCHELRSRQIHITIETAGTIDRDLPCDLMSISPKLSASAPDPVQHPRWAVLHEQRRLPIEIMQRLANTADDYQIKFVVSSCQEFREIDEVVQALDVQASDVWLMPEGVTAEQMNEGRKWIEPHCAVTGYHFCDRMQIHWYGNRRGT